MDEVVDFESSEALSDAQKVALALHRAFLTNPAGVSRETRAAARDAFSAHQIVELVFKFIWWSTNRATVTLGDDSPHDTERLTAFHFDADGRYIVHDGFAS